MRFRTPCANMNVGVYMLKTKKLSSVFRTEIDYIYQNDLCDLDRNNLTLKNFANKNSQDKFLLKDYPLSIRVLSTYLIQYENRLCTCKYTRTNARLTD